MKKQYIVIQGSTYGSGDEEHIIGIFEFDSLKFEVEDNCSRELFNNTEFQSLTAEMISPSFFISEPNLGGVWDDPTDVSLLIEELSHYKNRKIAHLNLQIDEIEKLGQQE
jgi:hypothetical protein